MHILTPPTNKKPDISLKFNKIKLNRLLVNEITYQCGPPNAVPNYVNVRRPGTQAFHYILCAQTCAAVSQTHMKQSNNMDATLLCCKP